MASGYFGTDGIRGAVNGPVIRPEVMLRLGQAIGSELRSTTSAPRVVIGQDTRASCAMIEAALVSGLVSSGVNVISLGCVPTPATALLTRSLRADLGIMITASHNPVSDNGVKLFASDGFKVDDALQARLEGHLASSAAIPAADAKAYGRPSAFPSARERYIEAARAAFPRSLTLSGLKVAVDAANGAAFETAPTLLWELGAQVSVIGGSPDGTNINAECGATHPQALAEHVRASGADVGLAFDGDADRLIVVDENGKVVDGDQILAAIALDMQERESLKGGGLVSTIMSNLGLERLMQSRGLTLERTAVGDRHVVSAMRSGGFNVGGEQSGHVVLTDHVTTGDGLVAGLQILAVMQRHSRPASLALNQFVPVPQTLVNVRYKTADPLAVPEIADAIRETETALGTDGKLVIRKSGTEPLVRVMVEATDPAVASGKANDLASLIEAVG